MPEMKRTHSEHSKTSRTVEIGAQVAEIGPLENRVPGSRPHPRPARAADFPRSAMAYSPGASSEPNAI